MKYILFICGLFLFSSCFEIVEEISFNADGSGKAHFTINMSQSKTKLKSIMLMDSINGRPVPKKEKIDAEIYKIKKEILAVPGISNLLIEKDYDNFIFNFSCNFKTINALNAAIFKGFKYLNKKNPDVEYVEQYRFSQKTFSRDYKYQPRKDYQKLNPQDKEIFLNARYICIYRFAQEVASFSNPNAILAKNKKAVMLNVKVEDLIEGKVNIKNNIQLK